MFSSKSPGLNVVKMATASNAAAWCQFCQGSDGSGAKYSCPKCQAPYCSLKCYRHPDHEQCSENFYKSCVQEEMTLLAAEKKDPNSRTKMLEQLKKFQQDQEEQDEDDFLDSDDEEDLSVRLSGIDLDDTDQIWQAMTKEERKDFEAMVESGKIESFIPKFKPFWENKERLVQEINEAEKLEQYCPEIEKKKLPPLSGLHKAPSPSVKFNLLNVLYAYCYSLRFYFGDVHSDSNCLPFVNLCFLLSLNLSANANFDSADQALESAGGQVSAHPKFSVSQKLTKDTKKDVYLVVQGPSKSKQDYYLLAALSDLKKALEKAAKLLKKVPKEDQPPELSRDTVKRSVKKLEFYLSWVQDFSREFDLIR